MHDDSRGDQIRNEQSWRELLRGLEVTPAKSLGQNFLHDRKIVRRIADVAEIDADDDVLEIGPGLGILTSELVQRARSVTAIELDARLANRIRDFFADKVTVVEGDVLDVDLASIVPTSRYLVVANLPYSIATAAIQRLFETEHPPHRMVLMVQREVAERMVASPPEMSILAVAVQFYGRARIQFRIGSGAFIPRPRVESAVIRIDLFEQPPLPRSVHNEFFKLVRAGFSQRRKRLDNAVASALGTKKQTVAAAMQRANLDASRRAETLRVDEWIDLFHASRELIGG